jgi:hypothetical protein
MGHVIGDTLLQIVARRLLTCVRNSDTISRQGGDEFVVLLPEIEHAADAAACARKIASALLGPHDIAEHQLNVTVTIGISIYPDDAPDAAALIACADAAMYYAKQRGRNQYQFFEGEMRAGAVGAALHREPDSPGPSAGATPPPLPAGDRSLVPSDNRRPGADPLGDPRAPLSSTLCGMGQPRHGVRADDQPVETTKGDV